MFRFAGRQNFGFIPQQCWGCGDRDRHSWILYLALGDGGTKKLFIIFPCLQGGREGGIISTILS